MLVAAKSKGPATTSLTVHCSPSLPLTGCRASCVLRATDVDWTMNEYSIFLPSFLSLSLPVCQTCSPSLPHTYTRTASERVTVSRMQSKVRHRLSLILTNSTCVLSLEILLLNFQRRDPILSLSLPRSCHSSCESLMLVRAREEKCKFKICLFRASRAAADCL